MTTICVRISQKEKAALRKHGELSQVVREAITLYLSSRPSNRALRRLKELQRVAPIKLTTKEQVRLISEDRLR